MNDTINKILELQTDYTKEVERLKLNLLKQFDIRVDLTLLRLSFREAGQDFVELELTVFEQELTYFELEKIDNQVIQINRNLELMNLKLDSF
jgi:hypothetical protein